MDLHQNARSCPASRALLVERVLKGGWKVAEAAEAAGMSERRAYHWLKQYRERAEAGFCSPRRVANKTPQTNTRTDHSAPLPSLDVSRDC